MKMFARPRGIQTRNDIIKILEVSTLVFVHFILPNWCKNYLVYTTSPLMHY